MKHIVPDYYEKFRCIADQCRHNCCIGWEIDIDEDTLEYYTSVSGEMGERLRQNIETDGAPHFRLQGKRCPFLNQTGLCDLITELGEEALCDVCTAHPRFSYEYDDRIETGLGLCCEAAGRLILSQQRPTLIPCPPTDDPLLQKRQLYIALMQDRSLPFSHRLAQLSDFTLDVPYWCKVLGELECLFPEWRERLYELSLSSPDVPAFDEYMSRRQNEYENLAVYCLFRHFVPVARAYGETVARDFGALSVQLIKNLGAVHRQRTGKFTIEDQIELARLFSSEIEYSDENTHCIFTHLQRRRHHDH